MSLFDSLAEYIAWLDDVPLPTHEQREQFADFVSHAHRWYRHLPPYPPGTPFYFFLNKYAGWARKHGTPLVWERRERGSHNTEIPTDTYRSAFGCLAYAWGRETVALVEERRTAPSKGWPDQSPGVGKLSYGLPDEILDAGRSLVSGVVHIWSVGNLWVWDEDRRPSRIHWPEESGGEDTLNRILERCRELRQPGAQRQDIEFGPRPDDPSAAGRYFCGDRILYELLLPERCRQQRGMVEAMNRVCDVVQRHRGPRE